ncbi:hypothetical protein CSUI_008200, partial [Cystoisospora suis]
SVCLHPVRLLLSRGSLSMDDSSSLCLCLFFI